MIICMEHPYERFWDRETRRHFDSRHAEGPYYGVVSEANSSSAAEAAQRALQRIVGNAAKVRLTGNDVFFAGALDPETLDDVMEYLSARNDLSSGNVLRGTYEHFPNRPEHLLEVLRKYQN